MRSRRRRGRRQPQLRRMNADRALLALQEALTAPVASRALAVAVSGGVDSLTLAVVAHRTPGNDADMYHAVSAAVPAEATQRVEGMAAREGWRLHLIDARELHEERYVASPVNRCLHCKRSLYTTIAAHTRAQIISGANVDDLGDYRPGLDAARESAVRHPYIEAGIDKATVRAIARRLGLGALSDLPASPCLSSRVETGIVIAAPMLGGIDRAERYLRNAVDAADVRCRVRASGVVIELDERTLDALSETRRDELAEAVRALISAPTSDRSPVFAPYRRGSAFVGKPA